MYERKSEMFEFGGNHMTWAGWILLGAGLLFAGPIAYVTGAVLLALDRIYGE